MPKTIRITGSSSGMGYETVLYFAKKGWNVAATMRSPDRDDGGFEGHENIKTYKLDVTERAEIKAAVDAVISDFGDLDVVVNNAGFGIVGPMGGQ